MSHPPDQRKPSQILSYLYLGGKMDAKSKDELQMLNIKYILNCTPTRSMDREAGCQNYYEKEKLFVYNRIPIFDNKGEDILSFMELAINFIEEGKHYGNVLVHCHKGISRSVAFIVGYLMKINGLTLNEALDHVKSCRPIIQPNSSFLQQLQLMETNSAAQESDASTEIVTQLGPSLPVTNTKLEVSSLSSENHKNDENFQTCGKDVCNLLNEYNEVENQKNIITDSIETNIVGNEIEKSLDEKVDNAIPKKLSNDNSIMTDKLITDPIMQQPNKKQKV